MVKLISFSAPAGAGKDYLADYLVQNHGFLKMRFAQPLYEIAALGTGLTAWEIEQVKEGEFHDVRVDLLPLGKTQEEIQNSVRVMLQKIGTEVFRDTWDKNVWVRNLVRRLEPFTEGASLGAPVLYKGRPVRGVVITDTRFPNEFDTLAHKGFKMVDIQAPTEYLRIKPGDEKWNHPSERSLDAYRDEKLFDATIWNDRKKDAKTLIEESGILK